MESQDPVNGDSRKRGVTNPFPAKVHAALGMMRQANTHKTQLELQKEACEKRIMKEIADALKGKKSLKKKKLDDKNQHSDLMKNLERPPVKLRSLSDLKRSAATFYAFANTTRNLYKVDEKIGKPRPIFTDLVKEIKKIQEEGRLEEKIINKYPTQIHRPISAPRKRDVAFDVVSPLRPKSASTSTVFHRTLVLEKRNAILLKKEQDLLDKISLRENSAQNAFDIFLREKRQRAFLILVALIQHQGVTRKVWDSLMAKKKARAHNSFAQAINWAVKVIGSWWWGMSIMLKIKRNSRLIKLLSGGILRFRLMLCRRAKHKAVGLIKIFIKACGSLSDKVRLMKKWRGKIIKLQRYVRDYIRIQEARQILLWMALERIEKERLNRRRKDFIANQKGALRAMTALQGFSNTLKYMNIVQAKIHRVLDDYDMKKKHWHTSEELQRNSDGNPQVSYGPFMNNLVANKKESSTRRWIKHILAVPATRDKLQNIRFILKSQRRRHLLFMNEATSLLKKAEKKINESALKIFLKDPDKHDGLDQVFEIRDKLGKKIEESANSAPPFLLLTKGALAYIDQMPEEIVNSE